MGAVPEVLVVGAGPAGVAAAITLAQRGRKVMLVDKRTGPRLSLGEVLPPGAAPCLKALGQYELFDGGCHLRSWRQQSSWGGPGLATKDLEMHPHGCAWHLDRAAFEEGLLAGARRAGAEVAMGSKLTGMFREATDGLWAVMLESHGLVRPRFLVDATGRASTIARAQGARRYRRDRLVALVSFVERSDGDEVGLLVEARPSGWWYTAQLPSGRAAAALFMDADQVPAGRLIQEAYWARALRGTSYVQHRLHVSGARQVVATPAGVERLDRIVGDGWIAVGDAAVAFDPLSSMGIAHGLESGRLGGLAVDAALAGESRLVVAYERIEKQLADESDILRQGYYAAESRWSENLFWARRSARLSTGEDAHAHIKRN